jgi:pyridoxal phosphate enzyme (YggS family)
MADQAAGEPCGSIAAGIRQNLDQVLERIAAASVRAARMPDDVTLVAVTKTHPPDVVSQALSCGVRHLGENRVEELEAKRPEVDRLVPPGSAVPVWHMVGHVQSRKAARAIQVADVIESVDSLKLARRLETGAAESGRIIPVLLEINVSGEDTKYGWPAWRWERDQDQAAAVSAWVAALLDCQHLKVQGLMTMAPWAVDRHVLRTVFQSLRRMLEWLRGEFPEGNWRHLSMGMSDDYEIAIEEGATIVRIGRAIFGPRLQSWGQ